MDNAEGILPTEQYRHEPDVSFVFARHTGPSVNDINYVRVTSGDIDTHPWQEESLMERLQDVRPRVLAIDGAIPGFRPAALDTLSHEQKEERMLSKGQAHPPWLWYVQPGRPSLYADVDLQDPNRDHIFHVAGDVTRDAQGIFRYLISQEEVAAAFSDYLLNPNQGSFDANNLHFDLSAYQENLFGKIAFSSVILAGLVTGVTPGLFAGRSTRRQFLQRMGIGAGLGAAAGLLGGSLPIAPATQATMRNQVEGYMRMIAQASSHADSEEIQKMLLQYYSQLDEDQNLHVSLLQGRTAIVSAKLNEALRRKVQSGQSTDSVSPAVMLFGNAHSLEAEQVLRSKDEANRLIARYRQCIFDGLDKVNHTAGKSRNKGIAEMVLSQDQIAAIRQTMMKCIAMTSIQRVYDPDSITIRDDMQTIGTDVYGKFRLLVQPDEVFISDDVLSALQSG